MVAGRVFGGVAAASCSAIGMPRASWRGLALVATASGKERGAVTPNQIGALHCRKDVTVRRSIAAALIVGLLPLLSGCASPQQKYATLLQRELNTSPTSDGVRGWRGSDTGVKIIVDSRYAEFDDSAQSLMFDISLDEMMLDTTLRYVEARTNFHPDPKKYRIYIVGDNGHTYGSQTLASMRNDMKKLGGSVKLDMKAWGKDEQKLAASATPAPLAPLRDTCDKADSNASKALNALDDGAQSALDVIAKGRSALLSCVTDRRYGIEGRTLAVEAMAEHDLGESSASVDASLASQQLMKCSEAESGSREGAQCETLAMKITQARFMWMADL